METSPNQPQSETTTSTTTTGGSNHHQQPPPLSSPKQPTTTRSEPTSPYPTTFVQADTNSFKQVVQMLTGSPKPKPITTQQTDPVPKPNSSTHHHPYHHIPPVRSIPKKTQSGFKLYERRNPLKSLKINPLLNPGFGQTIPGQPGFSPRKPELLSPSILDLRALALSPVTPLIHDPFDRTGNCFGTGYGYGSGSGSSNSSCNGGLDTEAEDKAIKEKGFFLHPISPATTPTGSGEQPRLLPLFPVTSPRVSGSSSDVVSCSSLTS